MTNPQTNLISSVFSDLRRYNQKVGFLGIILTYFYEPGFRFTCNHRLASSFYANGFLRLGKLLWHSNSRRYGCYFHLTSELGGGLYLPHPTSIVVGEHAILKEEVTLYQNVTIGKGSDGGYPTICERVTIYPGATLFGSITIGESVIIGANGLVKTSVPAKHTLKPVSAHKQYAQK